MNKLKTSFAFILLFATAFFSSCTTEIEPYEGTIPGANNPSNPSNPSSPAVFKADFDGQTFTANTIQAIVNSDYVAITGIKSSGEFFQITIPGATVGTYTLDMTNSSSMPFGLIYSAGSGNIPYLAADDDTGDFAGFANYTDTAQIVISSIDTTNKKISGTFKFTGVRFASGSSTTIETKVFTNGVFTNLSYAADVVAPTGNTFTAKLDGVDFVPTNITGVRTSGLIAITGRRGNIENIGLAIPDTATAGSTYTFTELDSTVRGQYILDGTATGIFGGAGTMTIISHDTTTKRIKGTFSFTASTMMPPIVTHQITAGTFDVTYL
ncbi:DUF6252 family protein [Flavobacterium humi]|uniref:Uncharacterized protein n=1 Tax=Flavobacterium humi TaxID=2562683 RepID=A0A4Z0LDA3_9FLAO|nr:DUF6252 family protein [Flavobacterium humi]TGD59857.1 hypothetical protein E4635_02695 [Flavobacterium humi]